MPNRHAYISIATFSYLGTCLALAKSIRQYDDQSDVIVLIPDAELRSLLPNSPTRITFMCLEEIFPNALHRRSFAFRYDAFELCCALKPYLAKHLFTAENYDTLTYLDSDMFLYGPLPDEAIPQAKLPIVLTPHLLKPANVRAEIHNLRYGHFNAGFFSVRHSEAALSFLQYWSDVCEMHCLKASSKHPFVCDQLWLSSAYAHFAESTFILKHPGINISYWNLHERELTRKANCWYAAGSPLSLFHWSHVQTESNAEAYPEGSYYQLSWSDETRLTVKHLFQTYRTACKDSILQVGKPPVYRWAHFVNGRKVRPLDRLVFRKSISEKRFAGNDPFSRYNEFLLRRIVHCARAIAGTTFSLIKNTFGSILR